LHRPPVCFLRPPDRIATLRGIMISVALIEDNPLVRDGLCALLNQHPDLRVIASQAVGDPTPLQAVKPDVILLDLGLQNGDSLLVAERVKTELPDSKVVVMDLLLWQQDVMDFLNAGVSGFIMKDATLEDFASTIQLVAKGGKVLPPEPGPSVFSWIASEAVAGRRDAPATLDAVRMTRREREVIELIAEGLSNKEMAARLAIATDTVKSHVRNIMEKLMLHTRLQISAYAHREGPR
jgi:DNA-binding NarL/FixJ family response regulator